MKTLNGPGVFLAQFIAPEPPFDRLDTLAVWARDKGFKAIQLPTFGQFEFHARTRIEKGGSARTEQDRVDVEADFVDDPGL